MYKLKRSASDVIYAGDWKPIYNEDQYGWALPPSTIFPDSAREFVLTSSLIPVIEFKLRYVGQDRIYLGTLRASDPVIADLFNLMDDLRTTVVDVSNQSVIEGTDYAIGLCVLHFSYTEQERLDRIAAILTEKVEM